MKITYTERKCNLRDNFKQRVEKKLGKFDRILFSLYVSIPFCPTRCNYCSFVSQSIEKAKKLIDDYLPLLLSEIRYTAEIARQLRLRLESVYVGGGTPTTLSAEQLDILLSEIRADFSLPTPGRSLSPCPR